MRSRALIRCAVVILGLLTPAVSQESGITILNLKRPDSIQLSRPVSSKSDSSWGPSLTVPTDRQKTSNATPLRNVSKPTVMGGALGVASRLPITPTSEVSRLSPDKLVTSTGPRAKRHSSLRPGESSRSDAAQSQDGFGQLAKQSHSLGSEHLALDTGIELHRDSKDSKPKVSTFYNEQRIKTKDNQFTLLRSKTAGNSKVQSTLKEKSAKPSGGLRGR